MKRILAMALAVLLLCGCTAAPGESGNATDASTQPTVLLYDPLSHVEEETEGAVRAYPLADSKILGMRFFGQDILLFVQDEQVELTTLMLLRGDELGVVREQLLDCALYPHDGHLRITEQSVSYYNREENSVVVLNDRLEEDRRVLLPDDVTGTPVLTEDLSTLYYCVGNEIRALDMASGISRLLKQHSCASQDLVGIHFSDTILEVFVTAESGEGQVAFISTENGQTLGTDSGLLSIRTEGGGYLVKRQDGTVVETLVGSTSGKLRSFTAGGEAVVDPAFSMNALLAGTGSALALYDLASGKISSRVELGADVQIAAAAAAPGGNYVWIQGYDSELESHVLYRWDVTATEQAGDQVFLAQRYTADDPDTAGLQGCQQLADTIGEKYGLKLYVTDTLPEPESSEFVYEYQVEAFQKALEQLDVLLAKYPQDFFAGLSMASKTDTIHIGFVRDMKDITGGPVADVTGLHYIIEGDHYIALCISSDMEAALNHQIAHVLDAKVYSASKAYDLWEELNPDGFAYLGSYQYSHIPTDDPNLQGDSRAFVDAFSMTYAKEDRARLFEQAMMEDNMDLFLPGIMQEKLRQLCLGIREAFKWQKTEIDLPWEQYLTTND